VPLIEIGLFIQVGDAIGLWPTLMVVLLTAIAGTALVRSQGAQVLSAATGIISGHERSNRAIGAWSNDFICRRLAAHAGFFH
jgi:UPF0716 protein FxsA